MGTVWGFVYEGEGPKTDQERVPSNFSALEDEQRELPIVLVRIDGDDESFPYSCSQEVSRLIPIVPVADSHRIVAFNDKYTRFMLPIVPAHARTGHSVQGYTAINGLVADIGSMFFAGDYVALSRAKDINDIRLLAPVRAKNFTNHPDYRILVHEEYRRLLRAFPQDYHTTTTLSSYHTPVSSITTSNNSTNTATTRSESSAKSSASSNAKSTMMTRQGRTTTTQPLTSIRPTRASARNASNTVAKKC
jgi:hypothetical protein